MSADLLAEFGIPDKSSRQLGGSVAKPAPETRSDSLIPGLEASSTSGPVQKIERRILSNEICEEPLWNRDASGKDVLFDASNIYDHEEDDFGDFVDGTDLTSTAPTDREQSVPASNLLNLETQEPSPAVYVDPFIIQTKTSPVRSGGPQAEGGIASIDDEWGEFEDVQEENPTSPQNPPPAEVSLNTSVTIRGEEATDDDWDLFEDGEDLKPIPQPPATSTQAAHTLSKDDETRPTNVPPPAILLQILPQVFTTLRRSSTQSDGSADAYAVAGQIIQVFETAARIMAGRALRWKRDQILAQSTKIGPAGKSSGMKLASIDKSEALKEQREASDVVAAWSKHAHYFNHLAAKSKKGSKLMSLSASMQPRLVTGSGFLTATQACALCGIRRNERIPGVDTEAHDSFGDFWAEYWGHRNCREFWIRYRSMLDQR